MDCDETGNATAHAQSSTPICHTCVALRKVILARNRVYRRLHGLDKAGNAIGEHPAGKKPKMEMDIPLEL